MRLVLLLSSVLTLASCGFVGWNVHNGTLVRLTVQVDANAVAKFNVGELHARIGKIVSANFPTPPKSLVIAVTAQP